VTVQLGSDPALRTIGEKYCNALVKPPLGARAVIRCSLGQRLMIGRESGQMTTCVVSMTPVTVRAEQHESARLITRVEPPLDDQNAWHIVVRDLTSTEGG
jgi:hypothetical protein